GCDYTGDCVAYWSRCGACPLLKKGAHPDDFSAKIFNLKRAAYKTKTSQRKLRFIANSAWTAAMATRAALSSQAPVEVIHFGLNTSSFRVTGRFDARVALGIEPNATVVMAAAHDLSSPR